MLNMEHKNLTELYPTEIDICALMMIIIIIIIAKMLNVRFLSIKYWFLWSTECHNIMRFNTVMNLTKSQH